MNEPIDIKALRLRMKEYDPSVQRCAKRVEQRRNYAPPHVPENELADWDVATYTPCCRPERHEGACRSTRLVLGWPGYATLDALLHELEDLQMLRDQHGLDNMHAWSEGVAEGEMRVVAYLRRMSEDTREWDGRENSVSCAYSAAADRIERGEHLRER